VTTPTPPGIQTTDPDAGDVPSLDVPASLRPRHVAIIMDGNGRWATGRDLPRPLGHQAGVETVRRILRAAPGLGIEVLTLYSFSLENWKRPAAEVVALMDLLSLHLEAERPELIDRGVRLRAIGRLGGLPGEVRERLEATMEATSGGDAITLALALNYGGRAEIVDATRAIAELVRAGRLEPDDVDESTIAGHLTTAGLPDPDLVIRTAGEMRISNFLLWQISYAELHVTPVLWPDFTEADLHEAIRVFASRQRRYGGLGDDAEEAPACTDPTIDGTRDDARSTGEPPSV